jgi:hypothetical protein
MVSQTLPPTVVNRLAEAFATSFWWSFAVCAVAVVPAFFLPGRMEVAPSPGPVVVAAATD